LRLFASEFGCISEPFYKSGQVREMKFKPAMQRTRVPGAVPGIGPATALPEIPERDLPQHPFCTGAAIPMLGGCGWS